MTTERTALVVGLGKSGRAAATLLPLLGFSVRGYDRTESTADFPTFCGPQIPAAAFDNVSLIVLSPGVPPAAVREQAQRHAPNAVITGELALGLDALPKTRLVLVTGTNGKSTVTALTAHLLQAAGLDAFAGGNLGEPMAALTHAVLTGQRQTPDALVLECSSFQLETFTGAETDAVLMLPITPDHLDRYESAEAYARTKAAAFLGATKQTLAVLPPAGGLNDLVRPNGFVGKTITVGAPDDPSVIVTSGGERFSREALKLAGAHNGINARYAIEAALHLGVTPAQIEEGLQSFEGLAHRMEFVAEVGGVSYYDDSKATNVASALAGVSGFPKKFVLIAGGKAKGDDFRPLCEAVANDGVGLVTLGEAGPEIAGLMREVSPGFSVSEAASLEAAVEAARAMAKAGQAVVLSPACASYDMFTSYAERGERFVAAVRGEI